MELTSRSAVELAEAVRRRELTAVEVASAHLERSERLAGRLGAFARLTPELALRTAELLDARLAAGEQVGPLAGVPCPIKDLNAVAGIGMEAGSAAMVGYVPEVSDDLVEWLADAGTVCTGKTATPEFGLPCYTEPATGEPARTPWDLTRMAGGSSGGAAAAVAAGLAPIAQASDGGGSIRIPASCCGLVGLKASRGRISPGRGRVPGPGLVSDGVLSRTVADTALALDVLAGQRPGDTYFVPSQPDGFLAASRRDPGRLRIGVLTTPVIAEADVHPACRTAAEQTAAQLAALGHDVVKAPVPFPVERWAAFQALWAVGAASIPLPPEAEPLLRPLTRWLREVGRNTSGLAYAGAAGAVQQLTVEVAEAWDGYDAVLMPTLAQPPLSIGAIRDDDDPAADFAAQTRFTPWTSVFNLSGRPAISLPLRTAQIDGIRLPIGVMLGGRFGQESLLLSLATQLEAEVGWQHPFVAAEF
ncbi:amidase [Propionicimonas paludicola]|uniref:Amidase n=1 Tax=Propionicimonas paludicola TaxID=185243 RepID=A0A2A9CRL6_9ACTN|nr:amidase [Propionicimonas paludicola]PFG17053.1 amidase [Propionicimonas paludicola]